MSFKLFGERKLGEGVFQGGEIRATMENEDFVR